MAITLISEQEQSKFSRIEDMLGDRVTKAMVPDQFGEAPEYDPAKYKGRGYGGRQGGRYGGKALVEITKGNIPERGISQVRATKIGRNGGFFFNYKSGSFSVSSSINSGPFASFA